MIELNGEQLKRYELNRTVTVAPRHGNRLYAVRAQQSEATEPIPIPTREENGVIVADIPNILMERYGTITIEVISIDKYGSKNFEKRSFVVHDNKKPDDYKYEENVKPTGGGATTWDDLGYSPTGGDTLEWDGNTDGLVSSNEIGGDILYKISDVVPTLTDFSEGATIRLSDGSGVTLPADEIVDFSGEGIPYIAVADVCFIALEDNVVFDFVLPEKGVYFVGANESAGFPHTTSLTIPGYTGFPSVKKVPEKYLPESVIGGSGGGGGFVLRPTEDELSIDNKTITCTTNYDEMLKALETGASVSVVLPESFGTLGTGTKEVITLLTWTYVTEGGGALVGARYINFSDITNNTIGTIGFTNGTYVPTL